MLVLEKVKSQKLNQHSNYPFHNNKITAGIAVYMSFKIVISDYMVNDEW